MPAKGSIPDTYELKRAEVFTHPDSEMKHVDANLDRHRTNIYD